MVGVRDSPHEVFDPWVRWDPGLDRSRSFRVVVSSRRVAVASQIIKNAKTENDDESYLEKRLGIVKHSILHSFVLRIFFRKH